MEHNCERHTFEMAEGECRSCLGSFCVDCLIFPFGADAPPYCKPCALTAGGIRSTARNPRRDPAAAEQAPGRSGGLLSRFRRGNHGGVDEGEVLTPDELIEIEAAEARKLLDAQRLPTEVEEESEPELPPTPNIAPPGAVGEDSELTHRELPDSVAGGLDLSSGDATPSDVSPDADVPAWARPDGARPSSISDDDPTLPEPTWSSAPEPIMAPESDPSIHTADGTQLFAAPTPPDTDLDPTPAAPAPVGEEPAAGDDVHAPVNSSDSTNGPIGSSLADMVEDTDELLRRIADLKGA